MFRKLVFVAVLLIFLVHGESKASIFRTFMNFAGGGSHRKKTEVLSPSPSPLPGIAAVPNGSGGEGGGNHQVPSPLPKERLVGSNTDERCETSSSKSCQVLNNVTACIQYPGSGSQGTFLIIHNNEKNLVTANATILPSQIGSENIDFLENQAMKFNITAYIKGSQSIVIEAGNKSCTIVVGFSFKQLTASLVKPMHGAFFLGVIILVGGGAWAYFKLQRGDRHLDGVPYQELEMGNAESHAALDVETVEGWDQNWDDEWDEQKAVRSPGGKLRRQANGIASRSSNKDEWENNWDD